MTTPNMVRRHYYRDGQIDWRRFGPWVLLSLFGAMLLSLALLAAYLRGWYLVILAPIVASLPLSGLVLLAVARGHCRSRWAAAGLGLLSSLFMYFGLYYLAMVYQLGPGYGGRLDLLPSYINWRMRNDVQVDFPIAAHHGKKESATRHDAFANWLAFGIELACVCLLTTLAGYSRAGRAFCEKCGRWKDQHAVVFPPGSSQFFVEAMQTGAMAQVAKMRPIHLGRRQKVYTTAMVEYCSKNYDLDPCPIYLSVKEVRFGGEGTGYSMALGKEVIHASELFAREAYELTPLFPRLKHLRGVAEAGVASPPRTAPLEALEGRRGDLAEIIQIPEQRAGRIMSSGALLMVNLLSLPILFAFFGGFILAAIGLWRAWGAVSGPSGSPGLVGAVGMIAAGVVLTFVGGYLGTRNAGVLGSRYLRRRVERILLSRPDRTIDPTRGAGDLVQVIPRANWGKLKVEMATDIGLLAIDHRREELLFEGDRQRYRIPASAIEDCRVESFAIGPAESETRYFLTVVRARTASGTFDAPFAPRATQWQAPRNVREQAARSLEARIRQLGATATPGQREPVTLS